MRHRAPHGIVLCRGSRLDCGSRDLVLIPSIPSLRVNPLMARRLKTYSDIQVPVIGQG